MMSETTLWTDAEALTALAHRLRDLESSLRAHAVAIERDRPCDVSAAIVLWHQHEDVYRVAAHVEQQTMRLARAK